MVVILFSGSSPGQCPGLQPPMVSRTAKEFAIDRKRVREWCQSATAH